MDCTRPLIGFIKSCFGEAEHYILWILYYVYSLPNKCLFAHTISKWSTSVGFLGYNNTRGAAVFGCIDLNGFVGVSSILNVFIGLLVKPSKMLHVFRLVGHVRKTLRQLIGLCRRPQMQPKDTTYLHFVQHYIFLYYPEVLT